MTSFFKNQAQANRNSRFLILLFALALVIMVLVTYGGIVAALQYVYQDGNPTALGFLPPSWSNIKRLAFGHTYWEPRLFLITASSLAVMIGAGTIFKRVQLGGGGAKVAQLMGGTLLMPNSAVDVERKVLNIVEEMAIASGLPVPPVYVMANEQAINAFAAGFKTEQAVIGVSQGAIERLTRDELQGVIAHEFSHILSGDMALNIRLMSLLHGIIVLTIIGRILLELNHGSTRKSSRSKNNSNPFVGLGLLLVVVGYGGVVAARLIRLAISRQREFFADASAVQFTRNPLGIGGALKKLKQESAHGFLGSPHTEEVSHMFFADALKRKFNHLFATHPPLTERIKRINVLARGQLDAIEPANKPKYQRQQETTDTSPKPSKADSVFSPQSLVLTAESILKGVGSINSGSISIASQLLSSLPPTVLESSRDPLDACLLTCCVLLDKDPKIRENQISNIIKPSRLFQNFRKAISNAEVAEHTTNVTLSLDDALAPFIKHIKNMSIAERFGIVELALSALRLLPSSEKTELVALADALIQSDGVVSTFEFCVDALLTVQIQTAKEAFSPRDFNTHLDAILTCLARLGRKNGGVLPIPLNKLPTTALTQLSTEVHGKLDLSLGEILASAKRGVLALANAPIAKKELVLESCLQVAAGDGEVCEDEFHVIRALALCFGCPLPMQLCDEA